MQKFVSTFIFSLFFMALQVNAEPTEDFAALLNDHWEWQLRENPLRASRMGDRRWNDQWTDMSLDAIERRQSEQQDFLRRLRRIDSSRLSDTSELNYDLFRRQLENSIDSHQFKNYLMPMSQRGGVQSLESTAESLRLANVQDYEDWLARMSQIATVVEQTMGRMEIGRESGYMPPKILMDRIPDQVSSQLVEDPESSPFFKAFAGIPDTIVDADRERLQQMARDIIDESVVPAYREFSNYFNDVYLPASRNSIGASSLPNGEAFYEYRTQLFTTTRMTPDEIHRLGLNEVKRIRDEMQLVIDELEFEGSFDDFLNFLRTDPQFYYDTPEELFEGYLAISKRIDPELVKVFGKLPRMPYGLRPIPENIAPDTTTAYYNVPAADGSRPGYYYVNLYRPEVRPKYEMEVLSIHEAVPGHHLRSPCRWSWRRCRTFASTQDSRHLPKAGAFTAKASGMKWAFIKTRIQSSAPSPTICGVPYASWSIPVCTTRAGQDNKPLISLKIMLPRPKPTSLMKSTATSPGPARRWLTKLAS